MTIKNTKKNISAENGEIVQNLAITTPSKANAKSNFSNNQKVTITFMDFFEEGNQPRSVSVNIPTSELVRLGYLEDQYYTKAQVDAKIKLHYEVVNAVPTAASVRQAEKTNYIFLVPFSPDTESSNSSDQYQEGHFIEYMYVIDDNGQNERMERIGSTKLDLTPFLKIVNLDSELLNSSNFTDLKSQSDTNKTDIATLQTSKVNVKQNTANGILTTNSSKNVVVSSSIDKSKISGFSTANSILTTDSNKQISTAATLSTSKIINEAALSNINSPLNANQSAINTKIDLKIGDLVSEVQNLDNYELKSDLKADVWGTNGFITLQNAEPSNSPNKNLKLGDYIYQHLYSNFYTKTEIDTLIGTLVQLQQQTLSIL